MAAPFEFDEPGTGEPAPRPTKRVKPREDDDTADYEPIRKANSRNRKLLIVIGSAAVAGGLVMAIISVFVSQYAPVYGELHELKVAQPWSLERKSLLLIHLFVFGFVGLVLGGLCGAGARYIFGKR